MVYIGPLSLLFSVLLTIDMYSETVHNYAIMWTVKPLLMPVLFILFVLNANDNLSLERLCLMIALLFSWLGDILLMQHRNDLFSFGLTSFLIVHVSYVISFLVRLRHEGDALRRRLTAFVMMTASVPFLVYILIMLYIICPKLNASEEQLTRGLFIPVVFYTFVIVGMAYISYLRNRNAPGFWFVFVGAVFFVLSDSILAFNKFVTPLPASGLFIMFTYGIGQYLITIGTVQVTWKNTKSL